MRGVRCELLALVLAGGGAGAGMVSDYDIVWKENWGHTRRTHSMRGEE